jgi:hypothetical protein
VDSEVVNLIDAVANVAMMAAAFAALPLRDKIVAGAFRFFKKIFLFCLAICFGLDWLKKVVRASESNKLRSRDWYRNSQKSEGSLGTCPQRRAVEI